jgi:hypothetical protein
MKLKQTEFCHNCNQYVEFEFDDVTEKQVIICPKCKHEHWRELDEGTLTNIRLRPGQTEIRTCEMPPLNIFEEEGDSILNAPAMAKIEIHKVLGHVNGNAVVDGGTGQKVKVVTERRWGRDPNQ